MEYADEENVGMVEVEQAIVSVVVPKFPKLASSDGQVSLALGGVRILYPAKISHLPQVWALRLPSAISFPAEPFHPDLYRDEQGPIQEQENAEDDTEQKQKLRALRRMHAVTNAVRWKWVSGTHGETVKRSNSRVIRWSDGTASLMIGQEMWDLQMDGVTSGSTSADKASIKPFALGNELQQESQSQPKPDLKEDHTAKRPAREGPISLLLATDFDNAVLVADSMVTGTLSLVPLTRNVRDHPKRLGAIDKSTFKASKILHYHDTSGIRPDKQIEDRVKEMQEQQKKRMKARGHDLNAGLSLPVWKGSSGGGTRTDRGDREGSPLGGGTSGGGKKRGGGRRTTTSYSSDEDMDGDGGRGAGGYGGGDYESDDFVVSCFLGVSSTIAYRSR
jgi:RNA polymerase-associated protein LEO1